MEPSTVESESESENPTLIRSIEDDEETTVEDASIRKKKLGTSSTKRKSPTKAEAIAKAKGKKASFVWDHFTKDKSSPKDNPVAHCNYCKVPILCSRRISTTSLKNHLDKCTKYPYNTDKRQKLLSFDRRGAEASSNLVAWTFNKDLCRGKLARMIVIDELPFSFVEGEGFRDFCHSMCPDFEPISRRTIGRDVLKLNEEQKVLLKNMFDKSSHGVSLTTDTWTSIQNINYMSLTAHFIDDDWKLHNRILNFCVITNHKGESIGKLIVKCIQEWGLKRVFTITLDNASANDVEINHVRKALKETNGCVLDGELMHVRCCAHILNLIVNDGLKEIQRSVVSIRNAVRYVRSSPSRLHKFKEFIKGLKIEDKAMLALDVPTRWNSTFMMLEAALKYQRVFEQMEEDDGHYVGYFNESGPPKTSDWDNAKVFVRFFSTFYKATLKFSSTLSVTSNTCLIELVSIDEEIQEMSLSEDLLLHNMALSMKRKYEKYWGNLSNMNKILMVACVLDPRYKMEYMSIYYEDINKEDVGGFDSSMKEVKDVVLKLLEWYTHQSKDKPQVATTTNELSSSQSESSVFANRKLNKLMKKVEKQDSDGNELEKYLNESVEKEKAGFDLLNWWQVNSARFPVLSCVARDVYAIPVSSVASESAFSTGGRIVDPFRSCLSPRMVEALVTTQNWIRSKTAHVDHRVEVPLDDIEFYDRMMEDMGSWLTTEPN